MLKTILGWGKNMLEKLMKDQKVAQVKIKDEIRINR